MLSGASFGEALGREMQIGNDTDVDPRGRVRIGNGKWILSYEIDRFSA